jgi:2-polyprenyl-6-methoxyphenol hydroxylase-like FAD-dependent oxidoreductase
MTRIAIIGAGQTGASAALALAKRGVDVTLHSDRSRESLRNDVPATGTAVIFGDAQRAEHRLGLRSYQDVAPLASGMSQRVVAEPDIELIAFDAAFDGFTAEGVDTRLKADDRIAEFQAIGGTFVVRPVDADALDQIAGENDLTLVATGKGGLASLFPRDEVRSAYGHPQRSLLMLTVTGLGFDKSVFAHRSTEGGAHAAFSFIGDKGEAWWGPYYHKDVGPSWSFLGWAKPGSEWERRFEKATDAQSALDVVTELHREFLPWDLAEVLQVQTIREDPHAWLKGGVTQGFRSAAGRTKSGHVVASLGDTSVTYDPLAGQGAQSGLIQTAIYVDRIVAHEGVFDEQWINASYEAFYQQRAAGGDLVTRLFLGHPELGEIAGVFISAANGSERFAARLFALISNPEPLLAVRTVSAAKAFVTQFAEEDADAVLARSAALIQQAQDAHERNLPYFKRSVYS